MSGVANPARLLLKARPTPTQLTDRLRPVHGVWPDGLELYLAAADLTDAETVETIAERIFRSETPPDFAWLIEGPVDSLDGGDFDVTRESEADLLVVERLADLARRISAKAINIHVIAPSPDLSRLSLDCRAALLERAVPFLARFTELVQAAGAVPTIENMPPVLRMRRSDFAFTPIGMAVEDFHYLTGRIKGLKVLVDTSHAGLYLNARRLPPDRTLAWNEPLSAYLRQLPDQTADLITYMSSLPALENAQISDAQGILGEGLAYGEGELDMDAAVRWLGGNVRHIVTETLEASNDDAVLMREALRRSRIALA